MMCGKGHVCLIFCCLTAVPAQLSAAEGVLEGRVLDPVSGSGVESLIEVLPSGGLLATDGEGSFSIVLKEGVYRIVATAPGYRPARSGGLIVEGGKIRTTRLHPWPDPLPELPPCSNDIIGVPPCARPIVPGEEGSVVFDPSTTKAAFPGALPETIRVGRRYAATCSGNPIVDIQTIDFEDYVKGVAYAEIAVFSNITWDRPGFPAEETFKAFAIAARSYALWFMLTYPDREYHIDDTACNQRYEDDRLAVIDAAVDATRGMILVDAPAGAPPYNVEQYEYAASCGRNTTLPEHAAEPIVDDVGPPWGDERACVGSWCGHDDCNGHEGCLVRGICQWGSMERSLRGDLYTAILAHYQPYLDILDTTGTHPADEEPETVPEDLREEIVEETGAASEELLPEAVEEDGAGGEVDHDAAEDPRVVNDHAALEGGCSCSMVYSGFQEK